MHTIGNTWLWVGFIVFVIIVLSIDLFVFSGRKAHKVSVKEALSWTVLWICLALIFNVFLWWYVKENFSYALAYQRSLEFFTGYLLEESLSLDNIFVFIMIFRYFSVPSEYQRRVLLYGVLGAIILRLVMILFGIWLVNQFEWILYIFGVFLIYTGVHMLMSKDEGKQITDNRLLQYIRNHLRVTHEYHQEKFMVMQNGMRYFTPLFVVLIFIELSDLLFAVDSIPAIFGITRDPYIVFTSNIFAIMGLRALYFLLQHIAERFHLLQYGIGVILTFIGVKMVIAYWFHVPVFVTLGFIAVVIALSIGLSFIFKKSAEI